jgi:hypothetical protein
MGALVGALALACIAPRVTARLSLAREYHAPFKMWCAEMASTIDELLWWAVRWCELAKKGGKWVGTDEEWLCSYEVAVNFLETHDLLDKAFAKGWTVELSKMKLMPTLYKANYGVEKGYHLAERKAGVYWSALSYKDRERHLRIGASGRSVRNTFLQDTNTREALHELSYGLKKEVL